MEYQCYMFVMHMKELGNKLFAVHQAEFPDVYASPLKSPLKVHSVRVNGLVDLVRVCTVT